ncbi:MlaD family protein [Marinobacter changyiensis]|uniref:MlaD family protein n=1 Tax=Marinobacter changyiensis TaxID=2604091 RepID=UPI001264F7FE|nr:MlaD family protein [Marinobacter changyiensis]
MEPRAHHVLIGLFTVVSLGAALLFALWLGQTGTDREYVWYRVIFERGVSGLSEGNTVQYSGISVGDVMELSLDPDDPRRVRVLIRVDSEVPIRQDTRAGLVLTNITGSMSVDLQGGTPESPLLEGGHRDSPTVIIADPSTLSTVLASSEQLFTKIDSLLTNANALISEDNVDNLSRILINLERASTGMLAQGGQIDQLMMRLTSTSIQAEETLATYRQLGDKANALLDTEGRDMLASARRTILALEASASRLDELTETNRGSLDQGMRGVGELAPALRELRSTMRNLNRVVQRLEDDPAGMLLGREPIQEFNP